MPEPADPTVKRRMERQARRDTSPEMALRSELWRRGLRYFVDRPIGPNHRRRVDVVFPRAKVAVFVDGCFWHSCPEHGTIPKNNREWWQAKMQANVTRDRETDRQLTAAGWTVVRVWEHEDPGSAASAVQCIVVEARLT